MSRQRTPMKRLGYARGGGRAVRLPRQRSGIFRHRRDVVHRRRGPPVGRHVDPPGSRARRLARGRRETLRRAVIQPEPPPSPATVSEEPLPPLPRRTVLTVLREYFLGEEPTLLTALVPTCFLSMALYTRSPATNFIFDEQEALLANPYVRAAADPAAKIRWLDAFRRDFWGLPPERTIGSYRPLPDMIWRALWKIGAREQSAFPHDYVNVLLHGLNGALVVLLVTRWTRDRLTAWLAGGLFVATAVTTEAVSGVVGIADVLGGTGALLALLALNLRLPWMPLALLGATMLGLYSKESALCVVALAPLAALLTAQITHPERPLRWARTLVAAAATGAGFVFYVEMRRRWFPVATPAELSAEAHAHEPSGPARLHRGASLVRAADAAARSAQQPAHRGDDAAAHRRGAARLCPRSGAGRFPAHAVRRLLRPAGAHPRSPGVPRERHRRRGHDPSPAGVSGARGPGVASRSPSPARLDAFVRGPARHRSHAGRGVRDGVDRRLVHSRLQHSRRAAHGARRALLVLPGGRFGDRARASCSRRSCEARVASGTCPPA